VFDVTINLHKDREDVIHWSLSFPDDCLEEVKFAVSKAFGDLSELQYEIAYDEYIKRIEG
jgi:hypothetical protein